MPSKIVPKWFRPSLLVLILVAMGLRVFYFAYTHRTWEDALITVQHSEDFVRGIGLTHPVPPGEGPLHGFTSPLSVLLPLIGDLMHPGFGVTFLKLLSVIAGGAAVWLAAEIGLGIGLPPLVALIPAVFIATEHHQILWGMAGMETQVVTLCYLFVLYSLQRDNQWMKGFSTGLAMLARPDAAFLVLIVLVVEAIRIYHNGRKQEFIPVLAGLVIFYAPWLIFTTVYYGSPIPNTVIAKGLGYSSDPWPHTAALVWQRLALLPMKVFGSLGPVYGGNGTGFAPIRDHHQLLAYTMLLLVLVGAVVAVRRRHVQAMALFAYVLIYGAYLMFAVVYIFGWYCVPIVAGAVIGAFYGLWAILSRIQSQPMRQGLVAFCGVAYILLLAAGLPSTMRSDKYIQKDIDSGVRKQIGIYLGQVSLPTDTIASESLGYIGYYSGRLIYDYPGLCSRRVVQYLRDYPSERKLARMMYHLQPTYLVLRPYELMPDGKTPLPWLAQDYELIKVFQAPPETNQQILVPERNLDEVFYVYRHKGAPSRSPTHPS
jgi:hypothetical protein